MTVEQPLQSDSDIEARYRAAEALQLGLSKALNTTVQPHWIAGSDYCWYVRETKEGSEYRLVNPADASNQRAFDHQALATALSHASERTIDPNNLPITDIEIHLSPLQVSFFAFAQHWQFRTEDNTCEAIDRLPANWSVSPDGTLAVFRRHYNLWLRDLGSGEERPLTTDGKRHYTYACTTGVYGRQEALTLDVLWSPDSQRLFTVVTDARQVKVGPPLVRHVPPEEVGLRPDIIDPDRRVGLPGDEHIEGVRYLAIHVQTAERQDADYRLCPAFYPPYFGVVTSGLCWWGPDSRQAYFVDHAKGGKNARLVSCDTHTGATQILIEETADNLINVIPHTHRGLISLPTPSGQELVWYSERSGSGHLYLYDLASGQLKHPITQGTWWVRNLLHIDEPRRELIIQTAGRHPERNPYYRDICRVNMDTGELTPLQDSDDEYTVCDARTWGAGLSGVSLSGNAIVTTRSRVDRLPVSLLLDRDGNPLLELETADISGMPEGWQWPEPVQVKAADGQTDLYGVMFRPPNFSEEKSYPVIDCSSQIDFIPAGSFSNEILGGVFNSGNVYAALGFIVVMIRCRGTGQRSKAFEADKDSPLLYNSHQDDVVAAVQQLAERYPYINEARVGISGYPGAAVVSGLLRFPDFYKVGVSNAGFYDSRLLSTAIGDITAEGQLLSDAIQPHLHLEAVAKNLKGKLLLIHGMLDNASPVSQVFRLVEALQLANKDFDLLLLPNMGHGTGSGARYALRRTWDYFVRHLLDQEPPEEIELSPQLEYTDVSMFRHLDLTEE